MPVGGSLYVFLHGLFVVKTEPVNDLLVALPNVPGHVHKAGNWLAETSLSGADVIRLLGVSSEGNMTFAQTDFTIRLPGTSLTTKKRAATLRLPRPKEIFGLLLANHDEYVVKTQLTGIAFKSLATVQVLVYDYEDENGVSLENHYWEPCPVGGAMSLHIISTSEEPEGQKHEDQTEKVMNKVLDNYPGLTFQKNPRPLVAPWVDPLHPSYGDLQRPLVKLNMQGEHFVEAGAGKLAFAKAELEHPTSRLARLSRLGRLKRGKRPIESLWFDPDALSDRLSNCMTVTTE